MRIPVFRTAIITVGVFACFTVSASATRAQMELTQVISQETNEMVGERIRRRGNGEREWPPEHVPGFVPMDYAADVALAPAAAFPTHPALWAQSFADFERREKTPTGDRARRTQVLGNSSETRTGGIVGGADIAFSNVGLGEEQLLVGVTIGYAEANTKTKGTLTEQRHATTTIGAYGAYSIGAFSIGLNAKTDFVDMRNTFADSLASVPPAPFSGGFSVDGQNYGIGGTLSYRLDVGATGWYAEPSISLDYTRSTFERGDQFGRPNGSTLQGRAGATFGTTISISDSLAIQPSFGVFAFGNLGVQSEGSSLIVEPGGDIGGELQAGLDSILEDGLSMNASAGYRFGEDLQGAAARIGLRFQF